MTVVGVFGRPLGQAYAIGNPSVCNVGGLWPNGLSDRDDFWQHLALDNSDHVLDGGPNPPTEGFFYKTYHVIMGVLQNVPRHVPVGHLSTS